MMLRESQIVRVVEVSEATPPGKTIAKPGPPFSPMIAE